jgi:hypothetical protein
MADLTREPADRGEIGGAVRTEQLGGEPGHRGTVDDGVPDTGRRLDEVLDDAPRPVGQPDHVDRVRREPARGRWAADGRQPVPGRRRQRFGRHPALAHRQARPVQVGEERLHRAQPLGDTGGEAGERRAVEDHRHGVEAPRPVAGGRRGVWPVVHEVAGERGGDETVGLGLAAGQRSVVVQELGEQLSRPGHRPAAVTTRPAGSGR